MSGSSSNEEEIRRLYKTLEQAEKTQTLVDPLLARGNAPAAVRSFVARFAIWVWAIYIGVFGLFVIFGGTYATADRTTILFEVLKIAILPIVTFAIGHYFGSKSE